MTDKHRFPSITASLALAALSVSAAVGTGCQNTKFVRTDNAFVEQKKAVPPEVFLEQKPPRSFRAVGVIEVAAAADTPESDVAADARTRAQDVGCDVLVSRRLMDVQASMPLLPWGARIQLVHEAHNDPQPRQERERPQTGPSNDTSQSDRGGARSGVDKGGALKKFEFICGVYEAAAAVTPGML